MIGMPHHLLGNIIEEFTLPNFDAFVLIYVVLFDTGPIGAVFIVVY